MQKNIHEGTTMLSFCNKVLTGARVSDPPLPRDTDTQDSFDKYLSCTIKDDISYFCNLLTEKFHHVSCTAKVTVGKLHTSGYVKEIRKTADKYYPVYVQFHITDSRGVKLNCAEFELLRVPSLQPTGVFIVNGEQRVMLIRVSPAVGLFSISNGICLQLPETFVNFTTNFKLQFNNKSYNLQSAARYFSDGNQVFADTTLLRTFTPDTDEVNAAIFPLSLKEKLMETDIEGLREILNKELTLKRALGHTLSRDCGRFKKGTVITQSMLQELPNVIYVKDKFHLAGLYLRQPIIHPDFFANVGDVISSELEERINACGFPSVVVSRTQDARTSFVFKATPEREIISNGQSDATTLTNQDILAIISLLISGDFVSLHNRDELLLKKFMLPNEIFSATLRKSMRSFIRTYARHLTCSLGPDNTFGLQKIWAKTLWDGNYFVPADTINPVSTLAQVRQVDLSVTPHANAALRDVHNSYYGRICPYETPQSQHIGLTVAKSIGCKIKDTVPLTPYIDPRNPSAAPVYLTTLQELDYIIADKIDWFTSKDDFLIARTSQGIQRVPRNRVDFVNAFADQHISSTAALIPFAGANDAARLTIACPMLKQAVLLKNSEIPRVYTSAYKTCAEHFTTSAIDSGTIDNITSRSVSVAYDKDSGERVTEIPVKGATVTVDSVNFTCFRKCKGDTFNKGDIITDSLLSKDGIYSQGVNLLTAYIPTGFNYEDSVDICEAAAVKLTSLRLDTVKHKSVPNSRISHGNMFRYVDENSAIAVITEINARNEQSEVSVNAERASGVLIGRKKITIDYTQETNFLFFLLSSNKLQVGDKLAGRYQNKGVVSRARKNSDMPMFKNGVQTEILLNPTGVPSRMNIGQLLEASLGFVAYLLDINIQSDAFNGLSTDEVKLLFEFVYDIANSQAPETVISTNYGSLPTELREHALSRIPEIQKWAGCFNRDGTALLYDPVTGKLFEQPVSFGVSYMFKLTHESKYKTNVRAGILEEKYLQNGKQPTQGAQNGGGQKFGEMELVALAAHGADSALEEILHSASDDVTAKVQEACEALQLSDDVYTNPTYSESLYQFKYYLEALGIKLCSDDPELLPDTHPETIINPVEFATHKKSCEKEKEIFRKSLFD
jgi:DNA-directed RNA polymerase beta subunit